MNEQYKWIFMNSTSCLLVRSIFLSFIRPTATTPMATGLLIYGKALMKAADLTLYCSKAVTHTDTYSRRAIISWVTSHTFIFSFLADYLDVSLVRLAWRVGSMLTQSWHKSWVVTLCDIYHFRILTNAYVHICACVCVCVCVNTCISDWYFLIFKRELACISFLQFRLLVNIN